MNKLEGEISIVRLDSIDSTNHYAKSRLNELTDKTVVIAKRQTNGHGRLQRSWIDLGEDNLFMTIVLKPSEKYSKNYPNLTQYLSVVLCELFDEYGTFAQIKWPNDVLINNKKIAGILSETVIHGNKFNGLVLGVGVNLNADSKSLSTITDKEATALNIELSQNHIDTEEFIQKLLNKFFINYDKFLSEGFKFISDKYVKRICLLGKKISVKIFNEEKYGIAKAITNNGELILQNNDKEFVLTMGDIL